MKTIKLNMEDGIIKNNTIEFDSDSIIAIYVVPIVSSKFSVMRFKNLNEMTFVIALNQVVTNLRVYHKVDEVNLVVFVNIYTKSEWLKMGEPYPLVEIRKCNPILEVRI
jgi:hypothetical protein